MHAKDLIQMNNEKRKQLTEENENYYDKMLVYIRFHPFLSEQQTEEILIELLDHLLEAQANGKTAEEVFGKNPKSYCDDLIRQLPKEKRNSTFTFIVYLMTMLAGITITITGLTSTIVGFFRDVNQTFFLGTTLVSFCIQAIITFLFIYIIVTWLKRSAFKESSNNIADFLFIFLLFVVAFVCFIFIPHWIPPFGIKMEVSGYVILFIGLGVWLLSKGIDKKLRLTK